MLYDALSKLDKPVNKIKNGGSRQNRTKKISNKINTEKAYRIEQTINRRNDLKKILTTNTNINTNINTNTNTTTNTNTKLSNNRINKFKTKKTKFVSRVGKKVNIKKTKKTKKLKS